MQKIVRERLAEQLKEYPTVQTAESKCVVFRVGDDVGAVHF